MHLTKNGYVQINRHTYEHRQIFETHYQCCICSWGEVHHRNGIKTDNRIENLEGMIKSKHKALHMIGNQFNKKDMTGRSCSFCGSDTTYIKKNGWPQWFIHQDKLFKFFICRKCHDRIRYEKRKALKKEK
jgi:hypothetical protein